MKTNLGTILWESRDVINAILSNDTQGSKILIFGNGRSGSTVLQQMFSPNDNCLDLGELLTIRRSRHKACPQLKISQSICSDWEFINGQANYHLKKNGINQVCVHVKPMHVGTDQIADFLTKAQCHGWIIILLFRNISDIMVSAEKAKKTKIWHTNIDVRENTAATNDLGFGEIKYRMLEGLRTRWSYNHCLTQWGNKEPHIRCDFNLNLINEESQAKFAQLIATTYPSISIGLNRIKIKRNEPFQYQQKDLEVIEFLRKEEANLNNPSV